MSLKDYKTYYEQNESLINYLNTFEEEFEKEGEKPISTGFKTLDNFLDGGLFADLYCIGGMPGIGKTTFVLQIADQIAESGQDVLIFSLEMSKREILAKSLSRLMTEINQNGKATGKTSDDILHGILHGGYESWEEDYKTKYKNALEKYKEKISDNLYIFDERGIGVKEIREKVLKHYEVMGVAPVVIIDCLQELDHYDGTEQNARETLIDLRKLSKELEIPIIITTRNDFSSNYDDITDVIFNWSGVVFNLDDKLKENLI